MTKLACFLFSTMVSFSFAQPIEQGPTLKPTPSEILYRIGDRTKPLVLECATEKGESNVQFSWNKNGKPLQMNPNVIQQENEGTLVFLQPTTDDSGDYQCFGKSEAGVASTRTISVKPTYINAPEVKTVTHKPIEGRPFKLECTIPDSYPKPEIKWMYQFKTDPSISHSVLDKRITQSPDGTLWFSSVTKEDTHENFKYVCLAKTPASDDDIVLAEHIIEDVVPDNSPRDAELEEQYVTGDIVAKKGDVTMIYCIYGGTPLTPPDWYKDGKNMNGEPKDRVTRYNRSAGKRLLIRDTWLEDEGDYTCIVDNEIGQPKKHNMHLTVISAPEFVKKPEPIMVQKAGRDITMPCEIAGVPNAKVSWTFNAQPLQQNDRILFKQNENIGNMTVADLIIKNVNVNDRGYYGCKGANDNGSVYAEMLLNVS